MGGHREKDGEGPFLWTWKEGDFKKVEKPLEGLLLKALLLFVQEFLESTYQLAVP